MGGVFLNNSKFYTILPLNLIYDQQYETLSAKAIILYSLILNRMKLSLANKNYQDNSGIFIHYSSSKISKHLHCNKSTTRIVLRELETAGLIEVKYHQTGMPLKIYVNDVFGIHNRTYQKDKSKPSINRKYMPSVPDKEVSFDVGKAEKKANDGTRDFGNMKNKKRRHTSTFQY
jgi:DNA-binding transcriptional regulator YhcF (GntR family)